MNVNYSSACRDYALIITLLMLCSCKDDGIQESTSTAHVKVGLLSWHGEYAVDGCGFFIEIENVTYKPENENEIGDEFKTTENSVVEIEFLLLDKQLEYVCGDFWSSKRIDGIRIISIKKM